MSHLLTKWEPENQQFWEKQGRVIALRNLWISVPALLLAFVVWQLWSVVVVYLPEVGFKYTQNQLMLLTALSALSGATLRIIYAFMVPIFGGRRWTVFSTATLLIPTIGFGICIQNPNTSFATMVILALLCGFGGANFSSSMANIGYFFPKSRKGFATGVNAGLGNLGVPFVQFVTLWVIGISIFGVLGGGPETRIHNGQQSLVWLQNITYIWVPFIAVTVIAAWFGMNDLATVKASFSEQSIIFKRKHTWVACLLYLGTFGSFIGFSAALPLLIKHEFVDVNPIKYAFLGPLLGSIFRVVGGIASDKFKASRVTQISFLGMIVFSLCIVFFISAPEESRSFVGFLISFMILFIFVGLGNGSVFAQVPGIFTIFYQKYLKKQKAESEEQMNEDAAKETGAVLGFMGAIGAYGGFIIPKLYGTSLSYTGSYNLAFYIFVGFYVFCLLINRWYYLRKNAEIRC